MNDDAAAQTGAVQYETTPLRPFGPNYLMGTHRCEACEEADAIGDYGDAYICQRCYDEAEGPYRCIEVMRDALLKLEQWDMLTLTEDGKGAVTGDAPWARKLIADALGTARTGRPND